MIHRNDLDNFLQQTIGRELFEKARINDPYLANGGQILQQETVTKLALGVSLNEEFLMLAINKGVDTVIVHHGLKVETPYQLFLPYHTKRLALIFKHKLNIYGFHYALDAHKTIGNNAVIARELGGKLIEPYFENWGWVVDLPQRIDQESLSKKLNKLTGHKIFAVFSPSKAVKRLGVVSGGGIPKEQHLLEMIEKGIEVHITGEVSEGTVHRMQEMGITYLAAGHYATEVFGVQELGKKIKEKFKDKVEVEFIDIPNPI